MNQLEKMQYMYRHKVQQAVDETKKTERTKGRGEARGGEKHERGKDISKDL